MDILCFFFNYFITLKPFHRLRRIVFHTYIKSRTILVYSCIHAAFVFVLVIFLYLFFFSFNALRLANMQLVLRFYELDIIVTGSIGPHARSAAIRSSDGFSLRTGFSY